jgi:hypothetical protein
VKPIRWTLSLLLAIVVAGFVKALIFSWQSLHSGPFAFFKNAPGHGTVVKRGEGVIAASIQAGEDVEKAEALLRAAGFTCNKEMAPSDVPSYPVPDKNGVSQGVSVWLSYFETHKKLPVYRLGCIYFFGFEHNAWINSLFTDENGRITQSYHTIIRGVDG